MINSIKFKSLSISEYNALPSTSKTDNTIYFITDTNKIYRGLYDYTNSVVITDSFPTEGVENKLYINQSTLEMKMYRNGWIAINANYSATSTEIKTYIDNCMNDVIDSKNALLNPIVINASGYTISTDNNIVYKIDFMPIIGQYYVFNPLYDTDNLVYKRYEEVELGDGITISSVYSSELDADSLINKLDINEGMIIIVKFYKIIHDDNTNVDCGCWLLISQFPGIDKVGELSALQTTNKDTVVEALNELTDYYKINKVTESEFEALTKDENSLYIVEVGS